MKRWLSALALAALAAAVAGCGISTGGTGGSTGGYASSGYGSELGSGGFSPSTPRPASSGASGSREVRPAPCRLGILVTASGEQAKALALALEEVSLAPAQGKWQWLADYAAIKQLGPSPAEVLNATPGRLLALGTLPAGTYERMRLTFGEGKRAGYLVGSAEAAPKAPLLPAAPCELACPALALAAGDLRYLVLTVDAAKLREAEGKWQLGAEALACSEPAADKMGAIAGTANPAAAVATVQACWATTGEVLGEAKTDLTSGAYTITGLPPGSYYLSADAPGFHRSQDRGRKLEVAANAVAQAEPVTLESITPHPTAETPR